MPATFYRLCLKLVYEGLDAKLVTFPMQISQAFIALPISF
jgi:hypothetical protein